MKSITVFVFAAMALFVTSAPMPVKDEEDILRDKRSQYGVQYLSPCNVAAASAPIPSYAPYHIDMTPMHSDYSIPHYGYAEQHYRSIDPTVAEQEMSEHIPMARYGAYAVPSHTAGPMGPVTLPAHTNPTPAFGVFPSGNTGGCNVPLLFSCTPSIVQGQIVKAQPSYAYKQQADSYRGVDDHHFEGHVNHQEESGSHEHSLGTNTQDPSHQTMHQ